MERLIKNMIAILVVLLAGTNVQADLELVENFDSMSTTGSPDGRACTGVMGGTWDTYSEGTGSIQIRDTGGSRGVTVIGLSTGASARAIGFNGISNTIDNGETGIAFFRLMLRSYSLVPRTYIGLISDASEDPINSANADNPKSIPAGFGLLDNGSGGLNLVKTDGTTVLKADVVRSQWYNYWIVANNAADTFDLYLRAADGPAGEATLPTQQDLIESNIPFGVATTEPLTGIIFTDISGTGQAERIYIDEIYWDGDQGLGPPTNARNPSPADSATEVPRDVILSWTPGPSAATHDVYFGTSFADVDQADRTNPLNVLAAQGQNATTYDPGRLEFSQSYYWRIDEVDAPPDSTIHKGGTWQFTVEPFVYPIAGTSITATASSSDVGKGPENTVNGSGLDDSGLLHGNISVDSMWLSSLSGVQPTWIEFQFDKAYELHQMWVWNSNDSVEPSIGFGFKDVSIEYSINGIDYTILGTTHQFARAPGTLGYAHNTTVDLSGVGAKYVRLTANSNWGGILNQYGLSEVRFFYIPVHAREPYPDSGATDVDVDVTLGFRAGREAAKHDVYFSDSWEAVANGTAAVATVTETSYGPLSLDLGKTYYWRVDEVNEAETPSTWQGDVWDFRAQEYFVVDDFESYNDLDPTDPESNRIFNAWIDGYDVATNGALVGYDMPPFAEQSIVHTGRQAMPFFYDNSGTARHSEAERTFAVPQNWTQAGAATLVLHIHGDPNNAAEQMYVKVNDSKVVYGGDAADIKQASWQQWNIDLASLGASLQNVTKLSIGVGDETSTTPGGSGVMYFDDIRLYPYQEPPLEMWFEAEAPNRLHRP